MANVANDVANVANVSMANVANVANVSMANVANVANVSLANVANVMNDNGGECVIRQGSSFTTLLRPTQDSPHGKGRHS